MTGAERKDRREALVGDLLGGLIPAFERQWSRTNPDRTSARALLVEDVFAWADAVIAESDRREKDGK